MMSLLEIHLPDTPSPDNTSLYGWRLRGARGEVQRSGQGSLASLPAAGRCHLVIPACRVLLSSVRPPTQNRKKFLQALPYAVEDRIMAEPESVHVAAGLLQENGDLPVAIVDRAWLRTALDTLHAAGLHPQRAEPEILLAPFEANCWNLVWHGDGGFVRTGMQDGLPLDGSGNEDPPPALQLALAESDHKPAELKIYNSGTTMPDSARWSSRLGIPVTAAGKWEWPLSTGTGINLLQGDFAPSGEKSRWLQHLRPVFLLLAVMIALQVLFTLFDWGRLKFEKQRLNTSMAQSFRQAFPDAKVIVDAPLQMSRNLADLRHAAGQLNETDFLGQLAAIAPLLGQDSHLRAIEYQQGTLRIDLTLPGQPALEALESRLAALPGAVLQQGASTATGIETQVHIGARP